MRNNKNSNNNSSNNMVNNNLSNPDTLNQDGAYFDEKNHGRENAIEKNHELRRMFGNDIEAFKEHVAEKRREAYAKAEAEKNQAMLDFTKPEDLEERDTILEDIDVVLAQELDEIDDKEQRFLNPDIYGDQNNSDTFSDVSDPSESPEDSEGSKSDNKEGNTKQSTPTEYVSDLMDSEPLDYTSGDD